MFMQSASEAINNAPVICNHCFTKASEQDGVMMCCVFFSFYFVSTMRRKCRGLIDLDKHCWVV